jgi:hypothetical protein
MTTSLNRDANYVAVAGGVLDDGSGTIAPLSIQASTGRLKVTAIGITGGSFPQMTQTQINALSPINGQTVYNTTTDVPQIYVAGAWYFLQLAQ